MTEDTEPVTPRVAGQNAIQPRSAPISAGTRSDTAPNVGIISKGRNSGLLGPRLGRRRRPQDVVAGSSLGVRCRHL